MAYADVILADTPIGYWKLDEASGTVANDSSGNGYHFNINGGITLNQPGQVGPSMKFDGVNGHLRRAQTAALRATSTGYTVEAWVYVDPSWNRYGNIWNPLENNNVRNRIEPDRSLWTLVNDNGTLHVQDSSTIVPTASWHHIAFAADDTNNQFHFWLDGVRQTYNIAHAITSGTSAVDNFIGVFFNPASSALEELFLGNMQQVAFYNKVLTDARIQARVDAGSAKEVNYAAASATASAAMPAATVFAEDHVSFGAVPATANASMSAATVATGTGMSFAAGVATASASMPRGSVKVMALRDIYVDADTWVTSATSSANYSTDTKLRTGGTDTVYVDLPDYAGVESAKLHIRASAYGSLSTTLTAYEVSGVSISTVTWNTRPANGAVIGTAGVSNVTGVHEAVFDVLTSGTPQVSIVGDSLQYVDFYSLESGHAGAPFLRVLRDETVYPNVTVSPLPANASATMPAATVAATETVSFGPTPATANATIVGATVSAQSTFSFAAQPMTANATMKDVTVPNYTFLAPALTASAVAPDGKVVLHNTYAAAAMTASGAAPNAAFSNQTDKTIYAGILAANAKMVGVYIAEADPYRNRLIDFGATWYDLANFEAGNLLDPITGADAGDVFGTPTITPDAPANRKSVALDEGDYFTFIPAAATGFSSHEEISFRTARSSGRILYGYELTGLDTPNPIRREIQLYISSGYLAWRRTDSYAYTGEIVNDANYVTRVRVDDNNWHHVIVQRMDRDTSQLLEIYADGQLALRRTLGRVPTAYFDTVAGGAGLSAFIGDVMWMVSRTSTLTQTETIRQYYAFQGYIPFVATPLAATADIVPAERIRGNETRVLCLYNKFYNDPELDYNRTLTGAINDYLGPRGRHAFDYAWSGMLGGDQGLQHPYDQVNQSRKTTYPDPNSAFSWGEVKVFFRNIYGQDVERGGYKDFITDEPRLIDLSTDVNIADYDIVFFADYEVGRIPGAGDPNGWGQSVIRQALDLGINVWCPQPQLAIDLGVVGGVSAHDWMRDRNNAGGNSTLYNYDYISPKMPGALEPGIGGGVRPLADPDQWIDTHFITHYRMVGTLEGFSDIQGYALEDMGLYWKTTDFWRSHSQFARMKFRFLDNGLAIGEEHQMNVDIMSPIIIGHASRQGAIRRRHVIGVPPGTDIAGTVIAQEQAKIWHGDSHIDNPYKDWALTIAVQPGDILRGKPVNGKIFVDFMGGDPGPARMIREVGSQTPDDPMYFGGYDLDGRRTSERFTTYTNEVAYSIYGGDVEKRVSREVSVTIPIVGESPESVLLPNVSWVGRAFNWLKIRDQLEPGATRFRATAMTASANAPESSVTTQKAVSVGATPMRARAAIVKAVGIVEPSVEAHAFPMTAHARITGYMRVFHATPLTATADMPMATIEGEGEVIPLYITFFEPEVYIKEGV